MMRLHVAAVGRIRAEAPERALIEDYAMRFNRTARPLGMGPLHEHEVEPKRGTGPAAEAEALSRAIPQGAAVVAMDERGREALLKYVLRPPIAQERITQGPEGLVRIALKKRFSDGTFAVDLDPLSLLTRLCASVPPPRFHTVRYASSDR